MKSILITIAVILINTVCFAQKNTALYTLENVGPVCIDHKDDVLYGVSWEDDAWKMKAYKLSTGKVIKDYENALPENPIHLMVQDKKNGNIYLVTSRKIEETEKRYGDAIYTFNPNNGNVKFQYQIKLNYPAPDKLGFVSNKIIFSTKNQPTRIYDTRRKYLDVLNQNSDYQLLNIAPEQNGFIMLNIRNIEGDSIPVFFMDLENTIGDKLGYYLPNIKIETATRSFQIPTINLVDSQYNWILKPIRYNCFPLYNFQITMRPFWLKQAVNFDKIRTISALLAVNDNYIIAKENNNILVYPFLEEDKLEKNTFSDDEISTLKEYFSAHSYTRELIDSDVLEEVFDAVFYNVYSKNKLKYVAVLSHGNYIKIGNYEQPKALFDNNFKLSDENNANKLQEALNIIQLPDAFNMKHIRHYKKGNLWTFVRGSAFESEFGLEFTTTDDGSIVGIKYNANLTTTK